MRGIALFVMLLVLGACSGDDTTTSATTTSSSMASSTTTTLAAEVLSLADKGFFEACGYRAIDLIIPGEPDVPGYITWLQQSEFVELQELAETMATANPSGVEAAVDELTRLCARAGYEFQ